MAITLHKEPGELSFSNDPIVFGFTTDNQVVNVGTVAQATIDFTSTMAANESLSVRWGDKEVLFTAVASPSIANELPIGTQSEVTLLPYFRDNHTINKDFVVDVNSGKLRFTARQAGDNYNLATGSFGSGLIASVVQGVNASVRPNFGIWIEVTCGNKIVLEDIFPIESNSKAEIDIHESIHSILEPDLPGELNPVEKCTKSHTNYTIRYAEVFGSQPQIQRIAELSADKYAILGGTSKKNKATPSALIVQPTAVEDKLLRYGSTIRYCQTDESQYLYFCAARQAGSLYKARIIVTYTDDTTHTINTATLDLAKYEKAFFDVSYETLSLGYLPKDVKSYEVVIMLDTVQVSQPYTYIIDYQHHRYRRHFAYVNSLGAVDIFTAYGKQSRQMEFFKNLAERSIDDASDDLAQFVDYNIEFQEQYQVATGFKSKKEIAYIRDFYLSPKKYVIRDKWYPIIVSTSKVKEAKDGNNLYAQSFEYSFAFRDDGLSESDVDDDIMHSPLPPQGFLGGGDVTITQSGSTFDWDATPQELSLRAVRSGGIFTALQAKQDKITLGTTFQYLRGDLSLGNFANDIFSVADSRYGFNNYGNDPSVYSPIFDAVDPSSLDPDISPKGELSIGRDFAEIIRAGRWNKPFEFYGLSRFLDGQVFLRKDASTGTGYNTNANAGLTFGNNDNVITDYIKPITDGFEFGVEGKQPWQVELRTDSILSNLIIRDDGFGFGAGVITNEVIFIAPNDIVNTSAITYNLPYESGTLLTNNTGWTLGGNSGLSGAQILGIDHEANINVNIFGSTVASFTPDQNFGVGTQSALAKIHAHESIVGNAEVALFRASNGNVDNFFSVAVDPTVNRVNLYNSGQLRVKNQWQFDALANFAVSPTTIDASNNAHIPNWGQVQNAITFGGAAGIDVFMAFTTNQTIGSSDLTESTQTASFGPVLLTGQTDESENGVYERVAGNWVRLAEYDTGAELIGKIHFVQQGLFQNESFQNRNGTAPTIGTDDIVYRKFGFQETDPVFQAHVAYGITAADITAWDAYATSKLNVSKFSNITNTHLPFMALDGNFYNSNIQQSFGNNAALAIDFIKTGYNSLEVGINGNLTTEDITSTGIARFEAIKDANNNTGSTGQFLMKGSGPNLATNALTWGTPRFRDLFDFDNTFIDFQSEFLAFDSINFKWKPTQIVPSSIQGINTYLNEKYDPIIKSLEEGIKLTGKRGVDVIAVITNNTSLPNGQMFDGGNFYTVGPVLLIGQSDASQNGVYSQNITNGQWYRHEDYDTGLELTGKVHYCTGGVHFGKYYKNQNLSTISVGSTNISYEVVSNDPLYFPYTLSGTGSSALATFDHSILVEGSGKSIRHIQSDFIPVGVELASSSSYRGVLKYYGSGELINSANDFASLLIGTANNRWKNIEIKAKDQIEIFSPLYEKFVKNTGGNFERDFQGLRISENDMAMIAIDENEGFLSFLLRSYNASGDIVQHETVISPTDGHLYKLVDGQAYKYLLAKDAPTGGGGSGTSITPTLQQVTSQGATSDVRLKFVEGSSSVNYATVNDIASAQNLYQVLLNANKTYQQNIRFNTKANSVDDRNGFDWYETNADTYQGVNPTNQLWYAQIYGRPSTMSLEISAPGGNIFIGRDEYITSDFVENVKIATRSHDAVTLMETPLDFKVDLLTIQDDEEFTFVVKTVKNRKVLALKKKV